MKHARSDSNSAKCKTDWTDFTAQVDEGPKLTEKATQEFLKAKK